MGYLYTGLINKDGEWELLGVFETAESAAKAYDE